MTNAFSQLAGNVFNAVTGGLSNSAGVQQSYATQKQLMKDQARINWKYYQKELQNRWRLSREGLVNGDFNPMLAAIGNITGNSAWASPQTTSDLNFGNTAMQGVSNANEQQRIASETELRSAQADNTNADTVKKQEETQNTILQRGVIEAEAQLKQAEEKLRQKDISNYERKIAIEEKRNAIELLRVKNEYSVALQRNQIEQYNAETTRLRQQTEQFNAETNRYKNSDTISIHGPLGIGVSASNTSYKPHKKVPLLNRLYNQPKKHRKPVKITFN